MWQNVPSSSSKWTQSGTGYEYMSLDTFSTEDHANKTTDQVKEKVIRCTLKFIII